jgi:tRNA pseudouridine55 synthase
MDGILVIDKPEGVTSHDVVVQVRRILGERRIGHTGTLDPFATGVLVLLVGRATRLARFLTGATKEYQAVVRVGYATDTGDRTGKPLPEQATKRWTDIRELLSADRVEAALSSLRGPIEQRPPMYSAKKRGGRKLYELARRGEKVNLDPISIHIYELELDQAALASTVNPDGTIDLTVRVVCSAGTYIRVLAEDFGKAIDCGAHLAELRRLRVGDFQLKTGKTLEQLKACVKEAASAKVLLPLEAALGSLPSLHLGQVETQQAQCGMAISLAKDSSPAWADGEEVKINDQKGNLVAIGVYDLARRLLRPRVVLPPGKIDVDF